MLLAAVASARMGWCRGCGTRETRLVRSDAVAGDGAGLHRRDRGRPCPPNRRAYTVGRVHDDQRAARGVPALLRGARASARAVALADPARRRPVDALHRRRHAAVQAVLPAARRSRRRRASSASSRCLRAGGKDTDLEDVGRTDRHCSFFEMIGNFSFGDYFKDEAVDFAWEWVTAGARARARAALGDRARGRPRARARTRTRSRSRPGSASASRAERIVRLGKDNFWQAAETGPCGQCSEIFYDRGEEHALRRRRLRPGLRLRPLHGVLQPRLHGVRPAARQRARAAADPERRHRASASSATAMVLQDVGSNFDTDGFRADHGLGRGASRASPTGESEVATKCAPRARRPRPRDELPDRRRRRAVERGTRLHLPPAASAARSSTASRIGLDRIYRLPARRDRADGRRVPAAARARRRDRARRAAGGGALLARRSRAA